MTDQTTNDGQKTVVAFIAGLLVGGLLVWIFNDTPAEAPVTTDEPTQTEDADTADADSTESTDDVSEVTNDPGDTPAEPAPEPVADLPSGDGSATVSDTSAGMEVPLDSATYPTDNGWIAVRTYENGEVTNILGAARYSREQGLVPEQISLLTPTIAGREYAIVFFTENGDRQFDLRTDTPIETPLVTFTAQ
ncbi:MAG TPA: hypothetical protein VKP88_00160 [Candidatus Paceibacterota bacterium]|nr:hypothetical protein [Candidatus Paceibacterota bacterium]